MCWEARDAFDDSSGEYDEYLKTVLFPNMLVRFAGTNAELASYLQSLRPRGRTARQHEWRVHHLTDAPCAEGQVQHEVERGR